MIPVSKFSVVVDDSISLATDSSLNGDCVHTKDVPLSSTPVDSKTPAAATDSVPLPNVADSTDVFIKSFVFSPEVPIRIDYEAKWFHSEQVVGISSKDS